MSPTAVVVAFVGLVAVFGGVQGQDGLPCHASFFSFTPRHALNVSEYMGDWYMHEIAGSDIGNFPAPDYKCASRSLSLPNATDITHIASVDASVNSTTGRSIVDIGAATINNTRSPFTSMWYLDNGVVESDIIIMAADLEFKQWTVVYQCTILPGPSAYRYETVTGMTRSRNITPETRGLLKALMVGLGFRIGDHQQISHEDCSD